MNLLRWSVATVALALPTYTALAGPEDEHSVQAGAAACSWQDLATKAAATEGLLLKQVASDGIETVIPFAHQAELGVPETLRGIWWISAGISDILTSLNSGTWDSETRSFYQPVYGDRNYTFRDNDGGWMLYDMLQQSHFAYTLKFSEDFKQADITPTLRLLGAQVAIPESLVKFTMSYAEDGHWIRQTWILGQRVPDYQFLRVVKADGTRDAKYVDYLKVASPQSIIAVKE